MSDCETEYEHGGYQGTEYYDSDNEMDHAEQEWADAAEDAGELPVIVAGPSTAALEADHEEVQGENGSKDAAALPVIDAGVSAAPVIMGNARLPSEVLDVLRARWAGWKESGANQRKKHWTPIITELQELASHNAMGRPELDQRLKVCVVQLK
jgi:hypothetical protein